MLITPSAFIIFCLVIKNLGSCAHVYRSSNISPGQKGREIIDNQLDELDREMEQELLKSSRSKKDIDICIDKPKLKYCKNYISYPIPKALEKLQMFQEGLAQSAMDGLTMLTKGSALSCAEELKQILCREKFPRCNSRKGIVSWTDHKYLCSKLLAKCPSGVSRILRQMAFCKILSKGEKDASKCIKPLVTPNMKYCNQSNHDLVSPWNWHSSVESESVLGLQFTAWDLSSKCKDSLSSYLCTMSKNCWTIKDEKANMNIFRNLCLTAASSCSKDKLSKAMKEIFLRCDDVSH